MSAAREFSTARGVMQARHTAPRLKIHFHSDCAFFAGCENMLANLCSSPAAHTQFNISFSYRNSELYRDGMRERIKVDFVIYPMAFPDPSSVLPAPVKARTIRRMTRFLSRVIFTGP